MIPTRLRRAGALFLPLLVLAACGQAESGPLRISTIGPQPTLPNPNRDTIGTGSAMLLDTVAQGLVRFDSVGEIEPGLAQSWIVSDDGRRYTFRLRRTLWARGEPVTADQIVARLQATVARNSNNALKPVLGAIAQVEAMTEQVLEIRLKAPRPNFLQLLAQPEMAMLSNNEGTGPYRMADSVDGALRLIPPPPDEDDAAPERQPADILLRGDDAATAIARFVDGQADLVTGGTLNDVPLVSAASLPRDRTAYDPARGLFGLVFAHTRGPLADRRFRHALAMAIDREAIQGRFNLATLQTRATLLPAGLSELAAPAAPDWTTVPFEARRQTASRIVAEKGSERPRLRIAMPTGPGYRILFAHIRRDWAAIGIEAVAVAPGAETDLTLVDEVAPADLVPWYLRHFLCAASAVCDADADELMEAARNTRDAGERQSLLIRADRALTAAAPFIALGQPVRWSLRDPRLNGFRTNIFARHAPVELIEQEN